MSTELGFTTYGYGPLRVLVLHDWFCDHSNWDAMLPYLTPDGFTYVFGDLRGYGASREIEGAKHLAKRARIGNADAGCCGGPGFAALSGCRIGGVDAALLSQCEIDVAWRIRPLPDAGAATATCYCGRAVLKRIIRTGAGYSSLTPQRLRSRPLVPNRAALRQ